jgi:hypothetical protein
MLERTFSFWRRWVGQSENDGTGAATATIDSPLDERRLWIRHSANLETTIQLTDQPHKGNAAAQLRDISRGGARLLLDFEIEPGQLINLELPKAISEGVCTVLACVVRAHEDANGQWVIGCVFSRELTDEDLRSFGAERVRHESNDQRTWKRFDCELTASFEKIGDPEQHRTAAQVNNLSASGVGLLVNGQVDAGALLNLHLLGKDGRTRRTILACVVHVTKHGVNSLALGCNFIRELSDEDIRDLIQPA